jgi:hypothetical protein
MLVGNIAIIVLTAFLFWICRILYKKSGSIAQFPILVSVVFWLMVIGIPNFFVLLSPVTTLTTGVIIDKDSRKPIAGAQVYAQWRIGSRLLAGTITSPYKTYSTKTNDKGEFMLPRTSKPLSFFLIPVYERYFDSLSMKVMRADYYGEISYRQDVNNITMSLDPIANADEYVRCLNSYPLELLASGLDNFEKKFSYKQVRHDAELAALAKLYENEGRYSQANTVYEEVKRRESSGGSQRIHGVDEMERLKQGRKKR